MKKDKVRLALVGCGGIAGSHINGLRALYERGCRDFIYTACCDPVAENAAKRAKEIAEIQGGEEPKVFPSLDSLVKAGLADGADLCLPHHLHHKLGAGALEGGLHVMIEKPLGLTVRASKLLIETAKRMKRILATAENTRRNLSSRAAVWAVKERGMIGEPRTYQAVSAVHGPFDYSKPMFKWRGLKMLNGGGMIMDSGAHFADMQQVLFGEPDEVSCVTANNDTRIIEGAPVFGDVRPDVEDSWHAVIKFKSGVTTTWTYSRNAPGANLRHGVCSGSAGTIEDQGFPFHCFEGGGRISLEGDKKISKEEIERDYLLSLDGETKERLFPYGCVNSFGVEIWDFADSIRKNRKPEMDGEDGLRAKALSEACFESAAAGHPVKHSDVLSGKIRAYQKPIDEYWGL
jgi:predicted dehydrogenase